MTPGPLDEDTLAAYSDKAKKQLRSRMKALRSGHSRASLDTRSSAIVEQLLTSDLLSGANGVALFWPIIERGEVDLRALDDSLRKRGTRIYYPFMEPNGASGFSTGFRRNLDPQSLRDRGRRFSEPEPGVAAQRGEIDAVIVPALAADPEGRRIGYGAGYYDATLGDVCPPAKSIIVVYHFQLLAELPQQAHDRICDYVVTDRAIFPESVSGDR